MIRLLIGVIVIGFLLYFVKSVLSDYLRPKASPPPRPTALPPSAPSEAEADQVKQLQDRIAVLEQLIVEADQAKPIGDADKNDGAGQDKNPPKF